MKKRFWLGMLVLVLVFGLAVVSCEDVTDRSAPSSLEITVHSDNWNTGTPTTGEVKVMFSVWGGKDKSGNERDSSLIPSDLSWVTKDKFELNFSGSGERTVNITAVAFEPFNAYTVNAKLTISRTSVPADTKRTATVYLTIPSDFRAKYEKVKWNNNTFQF